jgi:hypothetical protein
MIKIQNPRRKYKSTPTPIDNSNRTLRELLCDVARELDTPIRLRRRMSPAKTEMLIATLLADPVRLGRIVIHAAETARKAGRQ